MKFGTFAVFGCSLVVGAAVLAISYISAFNAGNDAEKGIEAAWLDSRNVLTQYGQKVQEAAQIPGMQRDDVKEVVVAAITSRYGSEGSKAMFQWIKEQNPTLNSTVYTQLQQIIESGRNDFGESQRKMIDKKRAYKTQLGSFWRGMWLEIAGYPKVNLDDFKEVTTEKADATFKAGKEDGPIQFRK